MHHVPHFTHVFSAHEHRAGGSSAAASTAPGAAAASPAALALALRSRCVALLQLLGPLSPEQGARTAQKWCVCVGCVWVGCGWGGVVWCGLVLHLVCKFASADLAPRVEQLHSTAGTSVLTIHAYLYEPPLRPCCHTFL
jgi:hypothetical protein